MGVKTLSQVIEMWLNVQIKTTRQSYKGVMADLLSFLEMDMPLTDVEPDILVNYINAVENRKAVKSLATVNKHIKTVKTFFNWAERMQFIYGNPSRILKRRSTPDYVRRDKAMSDVELNIVVAHARERIQIGTTDTQGKIINVDRYRDLALVLFLADTGARRRGAVGLKMTDLDMNNQSAIVTEKGNKEREVWFGDECAQALGEWFDMRSKWLSQNDSGLKDIYVFSRYGDKMTSYSLGQALRRLCIHAGIRSLGPHSLRHKKGHTLQKETDIVTASIVLGHSDSSITAKYYFKRDTDQAEAVVRKLAFKSNPQKSFSTPDMDSKIIRFPKVSNG